MAGALPPGAWWETANSSHPQPALHQPYGPDAGALGGLLKNCRILPQSIGLTVDSSHLTWSWRCISRAAISPVPWAAAVRVFPGYPIIYEPRK